MKYIITLLVAILLYGNSQAQNAKLVNGNYVSITKAKTDTTPKATGKTFTDSKGKVYPVYITSNDKLYVLRTSKSGNQYKQYLKL